MTRFLGLIKIKKDICASYENRFQISSQLILRPINKCVAGCYPQHMVIVSRIIFEKNMFLVFVKTFIMPNFRGVKTFVVTHCIQSFANYWIHSLKSSFVIHPELEHQQIVLVGPHTTVTNCPLSSLLLVLLSQQFAYKRPMLFKFVLTVEHL